MDEKRFTVVLNMGDVNERKETTEWMDVKSRVEEEKFRKLSADLERRRIRRYNQHMKEQAVVKRELDDLQRDGLRFEREKMLRRRMTFSTGRESKQSAQVSPHASGSAKFPKENVFSGGSASIAFDPSTLKYGSRHRRRTKTQRVGCSTGEKVGKDSLSREDTKRSSSYFIDQAGVQSRETSGRLDENRSWVTAWLDAKKEQNTETGKKHQGRGCRTSLMLKVEKDKMNVLSRKWIALKESKVASIGDIFNKKHRADSDPTQIQK